MVIVTTIRREVLTLPAAQSGPDNLALQIGYEPLSGLLPYAVTSRQEHV